MDLWSKLKSKGQSGAMALVTVAVTLMIGAVVIGYVYDSLDLTAIPDTAEGAINDTLDNSTTGLVLMAVGIIVMAAMFILGVMGSR